MDCSPTVDTRAAHTTSESAAQCLTSSTVMSLRNRGSCPLSCSLPTVASRCGPAGGHPSPAAVDDTVAPPAGRARRGGVSARAVPLRGLLACPRGVPLPGERWEEPGHRPGLRKAPETMSRSDDRGVFPSQMIAEAIKQGWIASGEGELPA